MPASYHDNAPMPLGPLSRTSAAGAIAASVQNTPSATAPIKLAASIALTLATLPVVAPPATFPEFRCHPCRLRNAHLPSRRCALA